MKLKRQLLNNNVILAHCNLCTINSGITLMELLHLAIEFYNSEHPACYKSAHTLGLQIVQTRGFIDEYYE